MTIPSAITENKNLLIITGAGASHDVADHSIVAPNDRYQPPLTKDLFKRFTEHQKEYLDKNQVAAGVGYRLEILAKRNNGMMGLEAALKELKENPQQEIRSQFYTIPIYLRDLFHGISYRFIVSGLSNNYKYLLDELLQSNFEHIVWINLNYDLFVDIVLKKTFHVSLNSFEEYLNIKSNDGKKKN